MLIPPSGLSPQLVGSGFNVTAVGIIESVENQTAFTLVTVKVTAPGDPATSIPGQSPLEHGTISPTVRVVTPVNGADPVVMVIVCWRL